LRKDFFRTGREYWFKEVTDVDAIQEEVRGSPVEGDSVKKNLSKLKS
jgi:hypothetical protein